MKVSEGVSVRGLGATRVDIEIEAESPDTDEAVEWVEDIYAAVRDTVEEKKGSEDT